MGSIYPHVTDCSHWPLVVQSQFFSSKREQKKNPHSFLSFDENSKEVKSLYHIVNFFSFCNC